MFTIEQRGDEWALLSADGQIVSTHLTYALALATLVDTLTAHLESLAQGDSQPASADGLLPEAWRSDLAFSENTGDGRDFSNVTWTSRDPSTSTMPLMLQTSTDMGHFGAVLAGYFTDIALSASPTGGGRFYDSEAGRQLRDMLLDGRRFGVSVDPGAVDAELVCTQVDEYGFCEDGYLDFHEYEIIGVTATPFPAFAAATIELDTTAAVAPEGAQPVAAAAFTPTVDSSGSAWSVAAANVQVLDAPVRTKVSLTTPPRSWFADPGLRMPTPLTITREGHVLAHVAAWGTCHVGSDRVCIVPPNSRLTYERLYGLVDPLDNVSTLSDVTPGIETSDGSHVRTGALTWGIPHADLTLDMIRAQLHYADSRHGWADVVAGEDEYGIWVSGALRPGVTADDVRILSALALSGDWRHDRSTGALEMIAGLAVNTPGFPIPTAVVASGISLDQPSMRAGIGAGMQQQSLVASGIVIPDRYAGLTRVQPCGCGSDDLDVTAALARLEAGQRVLERRTRHLVDAEVEHLTARFGSAPRPPAPASFTPRSR